MGDWNARVGSYQGDNQWTRVIGRHGLGRVNEAGLDFLSFCDAMWPSVNCACAELTLKHLSTNVVNIFDVSERLSTVTNIE